MNNILSKATFSTIIGVITSFLIELLGGWDTNLTGLLILMVIDFITGLILALFWGKSPKTESGGVSSKECWRGIAKKLCTLMMVAVACQADKLIGTSYIRNAVIIAFCVSEVISICENAGAMGILPEGVQQIFNKVIDMLNTKSRLENSTKTDDNKKDSDNSK